MSSTVPKVTILCPFCAGDHTVRIAGGRADIDGNPTAMYGCKECAYVFVAPRITQMAGWPEVPRE